MISSPKWHSLKRALFLVGAEHRRPIMDKISRLEKDNSPELNWVFNYFK